MCRRPIRISPRTHDRRRRLQLPELEDRAAPATFSVTTTDDNVGGDPAPFAGTGTLRQAIVDANASPGVDAIAFSVGVGAQTIAPQSGLPAITGPTTLDGTTQPGYAGAPLIELTGLAAGPGAAGLMITSSDTTVRGLDINAFSGSGIVIAGAGATGDGNDFIDGGAGNDYLDGVNGQDMVVGGAGADTVAGWLGEDALIGGGLTYVNDSTGAVDLTAVAGLRAEWARTDGPGYLLRISHLMNPSSGGLNGPFVISAATVVADRAADYIHGDSRTRDWLVRGTRPLDTTDWQRSLDEVQTDLG